MAQPDSPRTGWVLPVLLAVSTSAALGLGYLYLARPNAGELGAVRVVVSDDDGKVGNSIRVVVAEAPLVQKDTVSPGPAYHGTVHYPVPYQTRPNLKLASGKRRYSITAETETGFTWVAAPLPEDFREDATKDAGKLDELLGRNLEVAAATGKLKRGLTFEDFTWEAKGLRAPRWALPPKTFEQKGNFATVFGQEGLVYFPVPYASPPHVELTGAYRKAVVVAECTAKHFKWRNVAKDAFQGSGDVSWIAVGLLGAPEGK